MRKLDHVQARIKRGIQPTFEKLLTFYGLEEASDSQLMDKFIEVLKGVAFGVIPSQVSAVEVACPFFFGLTRENRPICRNRNPPIDTKVDREHMTIGTCVRCANIQNELAQISKITQKTPKQKNVGALLIINKKRLMLEEENALLKKDVEFEKTGLAQRNSELSRLDSKLASAQHDNDTLRGELTLKNRPIETLKAKLDSTEREKKALSEKNKYYVNNAPQPICPKTAEKVNYLTDCLEGNCWKNCETFTRVSLGQSWK